MKCLGLLGFFPGLHRAGLYLEDQVLNVRNSILAAEGHLTITYSTHLILDLHRGKDVNSLLQLLERGLLERIGGRRPDERCKVVVHGAEDVFTERGNGATLSRVIGGNEHRRFFWVIPEVTDVEIGFLACYHRLELWDVVIEPAREIIYEI